MSAVLRYGMIKGDSENKSKNENRGRGKRILKNLGLDFSDLNVYETPEPFVSYTFDRLVPQNVLIIENKDTFYTIRKYMQDTGKNVILGEKFGTIIYGSGKKVIASFRDFEYTAEKYLAHRKNKFLYFGDMDYEGIGIYEKLVEIFKEKSTEGIIAEKMMVEPFKEAYIRMLEWTDFRLQKKNRTEILVRHLLHILEVKCGKTLKIFW